MHLGSQLRRPFQHGLQTRSSLQRYSVFFIIMIGSTRMLEQHLVPLLVKLAVAASLASVLIRSSRFQQMLMIEERSTVQRLQLALVFSLFLGAGVGIRIFS